MPRWQKEAFVTNMQMVDRVKELAAKKGCTPGQLALAWVHAQGRDVFPIPGTKHVKYLEVSMSTAIHQVPSQRSGRKPPKKPACRADFVQHLI